MAKQFDILSVLFVGCLLLTCQVITAENTYEEQDEVVLHVNKIGPHSNPSETYEYYMLPFCSPDSHAIQHKHETLGEAMGGDVIVSSLYDIRFKVDINWQALCKAHLNAQEIQDFIKAIDNQYYYEMLYDDLPMFGYVGFTTGGDDAETSPVPTPKRYFLYTHVHFNLGYNDDQVISANVSSSDEEVAEFVELSPEMKTKLVEFSYSAKWHLTDVTYAHRMEVYAENPFFPQELSIHWLNIVNSIALVVILTFFLGFLTLRVLNKDCSRYAKVVEEESGEDQDDYGWKLISGDVFRAPPMMSLFSAIVGAGAQIFALAVSILFLAVLGVFYPQSRGSMYTAMVILYALTSVVSGYVSASLYQKLDGQHWAMNIIFSATIFPVPLFFIGAILNTIAIVYVSTSALPFGTIVVLLLIYLLVGVPLTILGGITARRMASPYNPPCRTKNIPREIPSIPWHRSTPVQVFASGFLPFSAIVIEVYYIFASIWGHKPYTLYGMLFLVFGILIIVSATINITVTYFQLSMEDYRWWWRSLASGGSTGIFVYCYAIYYYVYASNMTGALQTSFYFGYMAVFCYAFSLMLAAVGFLCSHVFIRKIYAAVKTE